MSDARGEAGERAWSSARLLGAGRRLLEADPESKAVALLLAEIAADAPGDARAEGVARHVRERLAALDREVPLGRAFATLAAAAPPGPSAARSRWRAFALDRRVGIELAVLVVGFLAVAFWMRSLRPRDWPHPGFVVTRVEQGYGRLGIGVDADGRPFTVDGERAPRALATHAPSTIELDLDRGVTRLVGACAYPDQKTEGEVVCGVRQQGRTLFESPPLGKDRRKAAFEIELPGREPVVLEVRSARPDIVQAHAVWLGLKGEAP